MSTNRDGVCRCIKTLKQARKLIDNGWAEQDEDGEWSLAGNDSWRAATAKEKQLLSEAARRSAMEKLPQNAQEALHRYRQWSGRVGFMVDGLLGHLRRNEQAPPQFILDQINDVMAWTPHRNEIPLTVTKRK